MLGKNKEVETFELDQQQKHQHRHHSLRKHLTGRVTGASFPTWTHHDADGSSNLPLRTGDSGSRSHRQHGQQPNVGAVLDEITAWLKEEKVKKKARKAKRSAKRSLRKSKHAGVQDHDDKGKTSASRRSSSASDDSGFDLGKLEAILDHGMRSSGDLTGTGILPTSASSVNLHRVGSRAQRLTRRASTLKPSDAEAPDEEVFVPGCDAILDNSKTFAHYIGEGPEQVESAGSSDQTPWDAWQQFKLEILRIAHTLKLSRWRHMPLSLSTEIKVERLSGALTNAVYVVHPPDPYDPNDYVDWTKHTGGRRKYPK